MNYLFTCATHSFWEEEGIIFYRYHVKTVNLETVKKVDSFKRNVLGGKPYVYGVDMQGVSLITSDARKFLATSDEKHHCKGTAVIVHDALTRLIVTFYLAFDKPVCPLKFFNSKEKAFKWLQEMIKDQSVSDQ